MTNTTTRSLRDILADLADFTVASTGTRAVTLYHELEDALRAELAPLPPEVEAELAAQAERDTRTMAPPVTGVTRHNGYIVRAVICCNPKVPGLLEAWWIAGEDPDNGHWVTWNAYAGDPAGSQAGRLSYDGGHYFDAPSGPSGLARADNKRRALADLAVRAGTTPEIARRIAAEVTRSHPEHGPWNLTQKRERRLASALRQWAG